MHLHHLGSLIKLMFRFLHCKRKIMKYIMALALYVWTIQTLKTNATQLHRGRAAFTSRGQSGSFYPSLWTTFRGVVSPLMGCGRTLEYLEPTCRLRTTKFLAPLGFKPGTFLLAATHSPDHELMERQVELFTTGAICISQCPSSPFWTVGGRWTRPEPQAWGGACKL